MKRRTFALQRDTDVTKVSGTGVIAEGVQFENGVVVLAWRPQPTRAAQSSVAVWPDLDSMLAIHGHDGATWARWDHDQVDAIRAVLAEREAELLALAGACRNGACCLHLDHRGPCKVQAGDG